MRLNRIRTEVEVAYPLTTFEINARVLDSMRIRLFESLTLLLNCLLLTTMFFSPELLQKRETGLGLLWFEIDYLVPSNRFHSRYLG